MNNVIKFTMAAGVLALMGCTDNNVSGAAIEGNAVAQNSSSSDVANNSSSSSAENAKVDINFLTNSTSSVVLNRISISVYGEEDGTSASCSVGEKSYTAKMKVSDGIVEQLMELKNFGSACDSVLNAFVSSCPVKASVYNETNYKKSCDEKGSVIALCHDARAVPLTVCTNTVPGSCTTIPADSTVDFNEILNDFVTSSDNMCNALHEEGGDDVVADSISFTLDEYTAQFTDNPEELSFDSHVLAYNAPIPFDAIFVTDGNVAMMTIPSSQSTIMEVQASEIPRFFPKMSSVAKDKLQKVGCKTYVVTDIDASQPMGHVVTSVAEGTIEITSVLQGASAAVGGVIVQTNAYFPIAFLVQDCDGLIDENTTVTSKVYTSNTWNFHDGTYVDAYGEWHRADLVK